MCSPALCPTCNKMSFQGCGQHLDSVFFGSEDENICHCDPYIVEFLKERKG